jgi:hypothetical protein
VRGQGGGPKSASARAASSRNAVTHGACSHSPVIPGESEQDWQRHVAGIMERLQPEGHLEEDLARLIALGIWRRWRIERFEVASITAHMAAAREDLQINQAYKDGTLSKGILPDIPPELVEAQRRRRILPPELDLEKITRYKTSEHRQLFQIMHEFEALQARRRGERSPLARLDISGPPGA